MADQWFYRIGENEYGPVKSAELKVLAESEMISRSTLVRRADEDQWVGAGRIAELFGGESESPRPRDPRARSRTTADTPVAPAKPSKPRRALQPEKSRAEERPKPDSPPPRPKPARPRVAPEAVAPVTSAATPRDIDNQEEFVAAADDVVEYDEAVGVVESVEAEPEAYEPQEQAALQFQQPAAPRRPYRAPRRGKSSSSSQSKIIILSAAAVVGCVLLFVGVFFLAQHFAGGSSNVALGGNSTDANNASNDQDAAPPPPPAIDPGEFVVPGQNVSSAATEQLKLSDFVARFEKATVMVEVITAEGAGNGSGFVADSSGLVVTNVHVIEKARTAKCKFNDFHNFMTVDVEGILFLDRSIDVAVLKLKTNKTLPHLELARNPPDKGEEVVAFGAPHGRDFTVTRGIVNRVTQAHEEPENFFPGANGYWVQTDAEITFGNSGGPLMSRSSNQVVGINTFIRGEDGFKVLGFASCSVNIREALKSVDKSRMLPLGSAEISGLVKWPHDG